MTKLQYLNISLKGLKVFQSTYNCFNYMYILTSTQLRTWVQIQVLCIDEERTYVQVLIYMYKCTYVHLLYSHVSTSKIVLRPMPDLTCTCTCIFIHVHVCLCVCMYMYMYICVCVCACVCMCIFMHILLQKHTM